MKAAVWCTARDGGVVSTRLDLFGIATFLASPLLLVISQLSHFFVEMQRESWQKEATTRTH